MNDQLSKDSQKDNSSPSQWANALLTVMLAVLQSDTVQSLARERRRNELYKGILVLILTVVVFSFIGLYFYQNNIKRQFEFKAKQVDYYQNLNADYIKYKLCMKKLLSQPTKIKKEKAMSAFDCASPLIDLHANLQGFSIYFKSSPELETQINKFSYLSSAIPSKDNLEETSRTIALILGALEKQLQMQHLKNVNN